MENVVASRLQAVQFGEVQRYRNIAILPLIAKDGLFPYRTLGEALATSDIMIAEVSASGSVPELLVTNRGKTPVLLIDGEELAGAKQNRVLNTSILLRDLSETRIPVSCTEQGRWAYSSPVFGASGNVMAQKVRAMKSRSVSHSLEVSALYHSDQNEVWEGISELSAKACCHSPTGAMSDVFKTREDELRRCMDAFRCVDGQVGLVAFTDAGLAGFDMVSLTSAYARIHSKLVRSYALECLFTSAAPQPDGQDLASLANRFMHSLMTSAERRFPSVGCGFDYRYRGESLAGAALVHAEEVIHSAFFQLDTRTRADTHPLALFRNRRRSFLE